MTETTPRTRNIALGSSPVTARAARRFQTLSNLHDELVAQ